MNNARWTQYLPAFLRNRIEGRQQVQSVLGNISWLWFDKVLRLGVGLVVGVWVARYLGAHSFGQLNFAQAFAVLFSPIAVLGVDAIVVRDIVNRPDGQNVTLGTAFVLRQAGSLCAFLLAVVAIMFVRPGEEITRLLVAIAAAAFFFQAFDVIDLWFQARVQSKFVVLARGIAFLVVAGLKVALILMQASLLAFAYAALAEIVLACAGLVFFYGRQTQSLWNWKFRQSRAKELLKESWPLFLAGISIAIYMRIDQVMLGYMLNDREVGIYSVAIKLVEIWYFIPIIIASSVFPGLAKARQDNDEFYGRRLQILYDSVSGIAFFIAILSSLFAHVIVSVLYGVEYAGAAPVLSIYAWASIPVFLNVASSQQLVIENRTRITLVRTIAGGVTNILLNLLLIPRYGASGAAIASLISYTIATFLLGFDKGMLRMTGMMLRSLNPLRWASYVLRLR